ncbi:hypothetical protein ACIOD2_39955 [Amycolatopsis sp. NPDC088138]|uniref:hypothetical protein n=1 Tax=Amycolatopsis sp. NPDC088138 TaxID=3363938 RepID=UPI00381C8759
MRRLLPLLLIALVAGCGQAGGASSALGFTMHAGAVQFPADGDWVASNVGLKALVPVGGCVLGIGNYANGYREVTANWTGDAGCTSLKIDPAPGSDSFGRNTGGNGWRGGGLDAVAAVPGPNGSVVGVGTEFGRREADGTLVRLAGLDGQLRPTALARSGTNLVAVGTASLGSSTSPVAWVSADEGKSQRTVVMPVAGGANVASGPWSVAAAGPELLAVGYSNPHLQIWASHDGGGSWTVSELPTSSDKKLVYGILPVSGQWLLYGETNDGSLQTPFVVIGKPGAWSTVDVPGPGGVVAGTLDAHGVPVLAARTMEPHDRFCSSVLVPEGSAWQRGDLGCSGSPVTAAATLADGRVLLAGNRDLWLRP